MVYCLSTWLSSSSFTSLGLDVLSIVVVFGGNL